MRRDPGAESPARGQAGTRRRRYPKGPNHTGPVPLACGPPKTAVSPPSRPRARGRAGTIEASITGTRELHRAAVPSPPQGRITPHLRMQRRGGTASQSIPSPWPGPRDFARRRPRIDDGSRSEVPSDGTITASDRPAAGCRRTPATLTLRRHWRINHAMTTGRDPVGWAPPTDARHGLRRASPTRSPPAPYLEFILEFRRTS